MDHKDLKKRLEAAQTLLLTETTTAAKFAHIRTLLKGVHPKIDTVLENCAEQLAKLEKLESGSIISLAELSAEQLPEHSEYQKKRKKYLLLFLSYWNQLKAEVARVEKELNTSQQTHSVSGKAGPWGRIAQFAKGPFGIVTITAVAAVVILKIVSTNIAIQNAGCNKFTIPSTLPFSLPGLKLPAGALGDGASTTASLPAITVSVDGTQPGRISARILGQSVSYTLPADIQDITFDGASLMGEQTELKLSDRKDHTLVLRCG